MRRGLSLLAFVALAIGGVAAGVFVSGGGASTAAAAATVKINVTASEFKFVLSKKTVPAGTTVIFTVTNKGKIPHDFKINGKKTPTLKPGKKALLTVKFLKKGTIAYICTLPGHAQGGMKGKFGVGVKPPVTARRPRRRRRRPRRRRRRRRVAPRRSRVIPSRARRSSRRTAVVRVTRWPPPVRRATSVRTSTRRSRARPRCACTSRTAPRPVASRCRRSPA